MKNGVAITAATSLPYSNLVRASIPDTPAISISGNDITLSSVDIIDFITSFQGSVISEGHYDYEIGRLVWNGVWDKRPALIAYCESAQDVQKAINFASDQNLLTAVRSGGHSISGKSTCDGGLIIDLSRMRKTDIDLQRKIVEVEAGCTLYDLDSKSLPHGYVVPAGVVSHTGVAGLTLGRESILRLLYERRLLPERHTHGAEILSQDHTMYNLLQPQQSFSVNQCLFFSFLIDQ